MDLDTVKPVRGLRVEQAGGEQQRRRRQEQPQEEFAGLLENSLAEEQPAKKDSGQTGENGASRPRPEPSALMVQDFVSISLKGKVGAEVYNARGATLKISLAQLLALGLQDQILPETARNVEDDKSDQSETPEAESGGGVDTLA